MKNRIEKKIEYVHTDGSILIGVRVIGGVTKIRQIVVYEGRYIRDNDSYSKGQEGKMEAVAGQIMFEFAIGRTLSAKEYKSNTKI